MRTASKVRKLSLLFHLLALTSNPNAAAEAPGVAIPFAISVSGGVSLGSYQAGYLYYQTQVLRANRDHVRPWIITGSSAGSINALISLLEYCEIRDRTLDDSLFWRTWTNMGFSELTQADAEWRSPTALFSSRALHKAADLVEGRWNEGLPNTCDVALGVTATLLNPELIELSNGISVQRQTMRFILRVRGRGPSRVPLIENYVDADESSLQPQLYLDPDPDRRFGQLRELLLASAAFPAAFDPVRLRFCHRAGTKNCELATSETQSFIDGGILENQPLRLALHIARQSLRVDDKNQVYLVDQPRVNQGDSSPLLANIAVRHVDTDARGYPSVTTQVNHQDEQSYLAFLTKFGMNFVTTARTRELYSLVEESPNIGARISSSATYFPRLSDPWVAFMGFLDAGFRKFDFMLGVSEAVREGSGGGAVTLVHPAVQIDAANLRDHLTCVSTFTDPGGVNVVPGICSAPELKNTRALAQTSWSRLAEGCLRVEPTDRERASFRSCRVPWTLKHPAWIDQDFAKIPWRRGPEDSDDGVHQLKLLESYGYAFDRNEFRSNQDVAGQVAQKLRRQTMLLGERQPASDGAAVSALGDVLANFISYSAPERFAYLTVGEASEVGFLSKSLGVGDLNGGWRAGAVLQSTRVFDLFKKAQGALSNALLAAVEKDLAHTASRSVIFNGALRAGYLWAAIDDYGSSACDPALSDYVDACSGWAIQPAISVTFLDRLRLSFVDRVTVPRGHRRLTSVGSLQFGLQVGF